MGGERRGARKGNQKRQHTGTSPLPPPRSLSLSLLPFLFSSLSSAQNPLLSIPLPDFGDRAWSATCAGHGGGAGPGTGRKGYGSVNFICNCFDRFCLESPGSKEHCTGSSNKTGSGKNDWRAPCHPPASQNTSDWQTVLGHPCTYTQKHQGPPPSPSARARWPSWVTTKKESAGFWSDSNRSLLRGHVVIFEKKWKATWRRAQSSRRTFAASSAF